MSETELNRSILLNISVGPTRLFRNNIGTYQDARGNWIKYGICNPGGSDLIGWHKVTITPDMVGCTVPVFFVVEGKFGRNKATKEQLAFIDAVQRAGGIGTVAYSVEDVQAAIELWKPPRY